MTGKICLLISVFCDFMWQGKVKILVNEQVAPNYFRMSLEAPQVAGEAEAGQFIHIRVNDEYIPLLRRPLSIHRISEKLQNIEILYEMVGKGTKILAGKRSGEELDILGPLGNGFKFGLSEASILVAGGMGVAPLLALAEEIVQKRGKKVYALIGAKTRQLVLDEKNLIDLGVEVKVATEDGSYGRKGLATDLLKDLLSTFSFGVPAARRVASTTVYACGPEKMLRDIAAITVGRGIPCQVSLENRMGCGVGVCRGCVVKVKSLKSKIESYKRVCKDGPVFEATEIVWE